MADKLPFLSDDHHYAIAAIATRAAQLDATIEVSIAGLLVKCPRTAAFILKGMNGDKYVGLLEEMLSEMSDLAHADVVPRVFETIRKLRTDRNEILHWLHGASEDPTKSSYASLRPHREERRKSKTAKEMFDIAQGLLEMTMVVSALSILALKLLPSPYKPDTQSPLPDSVYEEAIRRFRSGETLFPQPAT